MTANTKSAILRAFHDGTILRSSIVQSRPWTAEEEQRLLQMLRDNKLTQREIAGRLGRTEAAVSARLTIIRKRSKD